MTEPCWQKAFHDIQQQRAKGLPMCDLKVGDRVQITGRPKGFDPAIGCPYLGKYGKVFKEIRSICCPWPQIQLDSGEIIGCERSDFTVLKPPTPAPAWTFICPQVKLVLQSEKPVPNPGNGPSFYFFTVEFPCSWTIPINGDLPLDQAKFEALRIALTMAHEKSR